MPGFEEEAFARARQIHHSRPNGGQRRQESRETKPEPPKKQPEKPPEKPPERGEIPEVPAVLPKKRGNIFDTLLNDRENSVILILLLLLMGEENSGELVLALLYLLS